MFSLFKKKNSTENKTEERSERESEKNEMKERMEKEIAIHTMPEHFRLDKTKATQAKTTGIMVMVIGIIFIVILALLIYIFIFKEKTPSSPVSTEELPAQESQIPPAGNQEETMEGTLPAEDYNNLPSATTTPEIEVMDEATSTPLISVNLFMDADNDGLSAKEELLLGSSDENVDTDGDGYFDFDELKNLYNPAGSGKLLDNINIGIYENKTFAYNILYPLVWARTAIGGNDSIMFRSGDNNFVQVIVQPNTDKQSIEDWYTEQSGAESIGQEQIITNDGWSGIKNEDGSIVYLTDKDGNYIFALSYNNDAEDEFYYKNVFDMMVNSLTIVE
jgi:flagellar basal body-associated protein FliL